MGERSSFDVRDRYGKTQVVAGPESGAEAAKLAGQLHSEYVVRVRGKVAPRPEGMAYAKLSTGEIEVRMQELEVLNDTDTLPFTPVIRTCPARTCGCGYRYLDSETARNARHAGVA